MKDSQTPATPTSSSSSFSSWQQKRQKYFSTKSKEQIVKHFELETLYAWRPVLTWNFAAVATLFLSVVFVCIGLSCIVTSYRQVECTYTYEVPDKSDGGGGVGGGNETSTQYSTFAIDRDHCTNMGSSSSTTTHISGPIYIYYKLTNVNQNDSVFIQSVMDKQLKGQIITDRAYVREKCGAKNSFVNNDERNGKILHPCGALARSFFNDTLIAITTNKTTSTTEGEEGGTDMEKLHIRRNPADIAWGGDVEKFVEVSADVKSQYAEQVEFWLDEPEVFEGLPSNTGKGVSNGNFIVWMRPAALPTFRKLWGVLDDGLPLPFYVTIRNRYNMKPFGGTKSIVFSRPTFAGGATMFIGIAYCATAFVLMIVCILIFAGMSRSSFKTA
eukprot:GHVS01104777.1.p1 GENE.GHVS01104777.1~~GHVS01104777.1.p1  ORF type:complete len:385 (+),score=77.47 GHVS01104777.1:135-1289(+)